VRLLPLAPQYGIRIVLLNRHDYPGSEPLSDDEFQPYQTAASSEDVAIALAATRTCARDRAHELYEFLQTFVEHEKISAKGGIVISGWSLSGTLVTAFLAYANTFPPGKIDLIPYIRYCIMYNTPSRTLGYAPPVRTMYNPLADESLPPASRLAAFNRWVTG